MIYTTPNSGTFVGFFPAALGTTISDFRYVEETAVLRCMRMHGGGFHHNLAKAWIAADQKNTRTLRAAFADALSEFAARVDKREWLTHNEFNLRLYPRHEHV